MKSKAILADLKSRLSLLNKQLVKEYRTAEDYRRYSWDNLKRRRMLASLYRKFQRYFGRRVLDLGAGGGVLGGLIEPSGRYYVGVDANPDMIRLARKEAKDRGSRQRFMLGDFCTLKIPGRFDTFTLIGNTMGHLPIKDMNTLLETRRSNAHPGSTFIIDYRDFVALFYTGHWRQVQVQTFVRGKIVHRTQRADLRRGELVIRSKPSGGKWVLNWTHAIWSPFILENLMRNHGWELVARSPSRPGSTKDGTPEKDVDVYRLTAR